MKPDKDTVRAIATLAHMHYSLMAEFIESQMEINRLAQIIAKGDFGASGNALPDLSAQAIKLSRRLEAIERYRDQFDLNATPSPLDQLIQGLIEGEPEAES